MKPIKTTFPKHVAIICDGNRRWAREHGFEVFIGHRRATNEIFENLIDHSLARGLKYLTFWIFSTENWKRERREVAYLMDLFREFFDKRINDLDKKGVRVQVIGDITKFAPDIQERIKRGTAETSHNSTLVLTLAMNYGGRDEITRAVQQIARDVAEGTLAPEAITPQIISSRLDTNVLPDPDVIVRTSGEHRLSGFMLWQCEYSEFIFPSFHFPDFTPEKFDEVLAEFARRNRRFGGG
jgi:undecaprenyl diphosphate synthase